MEDTPFVPVKRKQGRPAKRPELQSEGQKELDKVAAQFDDFQEKIAELTFDTRMKAPAQNVEPQTKLSQKDIERAPGIYLTPIRSMNNRDKFNERFREEWNFVKEYVRFTAENNEIKGEYLDLWTRPYGGIPAEEWMVPVNKPVWGPRYLAERIKSCKHSHLVMLESKPVGTDAMGTYTGQLAVQETVQRFDAHPISNSKSIFMGS